MKFYKSFLFLFGLNFILILPIWFFLDLRFLVPAFVFLLILDIFLLFSSGFYLRRQFLFSVFAPEDPYGVSMIFEDLKNKWDLKNVQLLKAKQLSSSFFCFSWGPKSFVVLSEDILERFSKEDIRCLLSYPFQMVRSGDLLFLTLLSGFLLLAEKFTYFLSYPLSFFRKKPIKKEILILVLVLKVLSLMTRRIFRRTDKNLLLKGNGKNQQAFFLWKLDSLLKINPPKNSLFLAPLFLTNPLTDSDWGCYISLQPLIKDRVKSLIGIYPP